MRQIRWTLAAHGARDTLKMVSTKSTKHFDDVTKIHCRGHDGGVHFNLQRSFCFVSARNNSIVEIFHPLQNKFLTGNSTMWDDS